MNDKEVLELFDFDHLPDGLAAVSKQFFLQAMEVGGMTELGATRDIALVKLLEAKDAVVRCHAIKYKRAQSNAPDNVRMDGQGN